MRTTKTLMAIAFAAVLSTSTAASADTTSFDAMRASTHAIESREHVLLEHAKHTTPEIRKESERVVNAVAKHRRALSARLDLLEMLGRAHSIDQRALAEMSATVDVSEHLLDLVEKWLGIRR